MYETVSKLKNVLKRCINIRNMTNDIFGDLVPGKNKPYNVKVVSKVGRASWMPSQSSVSNETAARMRLNP